MTHLNLIDEAESIFLRRRLAVEELFDGRRFLMLGYDDRGAASLREHSIEREFGNTKKVYHLPDSTWRESHSRGCQALQLQLPGVAGRHSAKLHSQWEKAARELLAIRDFQTFRKLHGGFWCDVAYGSNDAMSSPAVDKFGKIPGTSQLRGKRPQTKDELHAFIETVLALLDECCHFEKRACVYCKLDFLPTGWTVFELQVGYDICPLCCHLATDWSQTELWLAKDAAVRMHELDVGLRIGLNVRESLPAASKAPQWDSLEALKQAKVYNKPAQESRELFLAVAVKPKLNQVRFDFESWDAWLYQLMPEFRQMYPQKQNTLVAQDGHICFSKGELEICNFLSSQDIIHSREPAYVELATHYHALVRHFVGDFRVQDVIIEYAGMSGNADYDKRLATKVATAKHIGIEVLVILPEDLPHLHEKLSTLS